MNLDWPFSLFSKIKSQSQDCADSEPELATVFRAFAKEQSVEAAVSLSKIGNRIGSGNHSPSPMAISGMKQTPGQQKRMSSPGDFRVLLSRLFWVASAVLYSDYEHEFLMAVRLMNKVLDSFLWKIPRI
eukprot:m.300199 g.300199  ORF g.300199 m.300199 type:complete len:129 (+) comp40791_c1_seq23:6248-6634(+)